MLKRKNKLTMPWQTIMFIIIGISIPLMHFFVMYIGINANSIFMSFEDLNTGKFTFNNFAMVFDELKNPYSELPNAFKNTLIFFFADLIIKTPLCFAVAFFFYKGIWGRSAFQYIFFLPSVISSVVYTACFKYMLAPDGALFIIIERMLGESRLLLQDSRYALTTLIVYGIWSGFGIQLILYTAAFKRIPKEVIESGRLDGLGFWTEIFYIIIPLVWPFLSTMLLLSFVGIFSADGGVLLFTKGAYDTYTISYWIFAKTTGGANVNVVAALGMLLTLISLPITLIFRWLANRVETYEY